jgi:dipeptidyl aminopeptidase/acylaminoacyl peptidase
MIRRCWPLLASTLLAATPALAQDGADATRYRDPPAPIAQILDTAPPPSPLVSPKRDTVALLGRSNLPPVAEIAEPELRLGGYRINPRNNGPANSRLSWLNGLSFQDIASNQIRNVPLPAGTRFVAPSWSPDGSRLAFLRGVDNGLELWVAERASAQARRVTGPSVNAASAPATNGCPTGARCWCA